MTVGVLTELPSALIFSTTFMPEVDRARRASMSRWSVWFSVAPPGPR